MNNLEAIEKRMSRRTYLETEIEPSKVRILKNMIEELNNESGLSILFLEDGSNLFNSLKKSYGMFAGVKSVIVLKGNQKDVNLREKAGYYGELLVLKATTMDLGTCWVAGTYDRHNEIFKLEESEQVICVIPIGNVPEIKTLKEKLIYRASHRKSKDIKDFYTSDKEVDEWFLNGMRAVSKAPSAMNSQKVKFEYVSDTVIAKVPDTYVCDLVDLGIAKLHFEVATERKFNFGNGASLHSS